MAICDVCGNDYDRTFTLSFSNAPGPAGTFDSFECAIHAIAPTCGHCGVRIIGHGVQADSIVYCCAHCARQAGETRVADRAGYGS